MPLATRLIDYNHDDVELEAFFACEENSHGQRQAILIAHMWGGRVLLWMKKLRNWPILVTLPWHWICTEKAYAEPRLRNARL